MVDIKVKGKTLKPLEDNTGKCVYDFGVGQDFLRPKKTLTLKENIGKLHFTIYINFTLMSISIKWKCKLEIYMNSVHQKIPL